MHQWKLILEYVYDIIELYDAVPNTNVLSFDRKPITSQGIQNFSSGTIEEKFLINVSPLHTCIPLEFSSTITCRLTCWLYGDLLSLSRFVVLLTFDGYMYMYTPSTDTFQKIRIICIVTFFQIEMFIY